MIDAVFYESYKSLSFFCVFCQFCVWCIVVLWGLASFVPCSVVMSMLLILMICASSLSL